MLAALLIATGVVDGEEPPAPVTPTTAIRPSGGWPADQGYRRGRKEISEARKQFGLEDDVAREARAQAIVADVAARQVAALQQDDQKKFEELLRSLELEGIEFEARYLEALNITRERLIDAEIAERFRKIRVEEEELLMLLMIAGSV